MRPYNQNATLTVGQAVTTTNGTATVQPVAGIVLRLAQNSSVRQVSATEFRVERGIANVSVHHPAPGSEILVDLPGGQLSLLKDGFYTFNAGTNTARTLVGEAAAFPAGNLNAKPVKVKEDHALVFGQGALHPHDFYPAEARADVVPSYGNYGDGRPHGYGPYGDGFYGYPYSYYAYGWGYPYYGFYGYPYFGLGFGYYGFYGRGFYGGGFRGGFRR
jgi:hypothetical protein